MKPNLYSEVKPGDKYNNWTVIGKGLGSTSHNKRLKCQCICGIIRDVFFNILCNGRSKSCGCSNKGGAKTHGKSDHLLYGVWCSIKNRCYIKTDKGYKDYGGRGVTMCDEWVHDFQCFYDWCMVNGYKEGLQLDKDKKAGGLGSIYSPEFCCFLTPHENMQYNSRINRYTFNGQTKTLREWSEYLRVNYSALNNRLWNGWSVEDTFTTPIQQRNYGQ